MSHTLSSRLQPTCAVELHNVLSPCSLLGAIELHVVLSPAAYLRLLSCTMSQLSLEAMVTQTCVGATSHAASGLTVEKAAMVPAGSHTVELAGMQALAA